MPQGSPEPDFLLPGFPELEELFFSMKVVPSLLQYTLPTDIELSQGHKVAGF